MVIDMGKEFERIILPIDGSEYAKKAAKKAIFLARNIGVDVTAIYVINPSRFALASQYMASVKKLVEEQAVEYLDDIKTLGREIGVSITTKLIEGVPFEEIILSAQPNDLIILGSKGKTALNRVLIGSVSEKVIRHAKCAVMIVK